MADIIENNPPMEETPLVNTNEAVIDQPTIETVEEGDGDPVKKGGTSTKKDTTPKYDNDNGQLTTTATETNKKLGEFAATVFKTTGVVPTYKGKQINDLSSIYYNKIYNYLNDFFLVYTVVMTETIPKKYT